MGPDSVEELESGGLIEAIVRKLLNSMTEKGDKGKDWVGLVSRCGRFSGKPVLVVELHVITKLSPPLSRAWSAISASTIGLRHFLGASLSQRGACDQETPALQLVRRRTE